MTTEHGTYAAYMGHIKRGDTPCQACRQAATNYHAHYRFRTGQLHDLRRCRRCGSVFGEHTCHNPIDRINNEGTG